MTSIFEAMGGYESKQDDAGEQAKPKRRRVDEYTLKLTKQQWYILDAMAEDATLERSTYNTKLYELTWLSGIQEWHSRVTIASLEKRTLIAAAGDVYRLTDAGRHALRVREENRPGSGLI